MTERHDDDLRWGTDPHGLMGIGVDAEGRAAAVELAADLLDHYALEEVGPLVTGLLTAAHAADGTDEADLDAIDRRNAELTGVLQDLFGRSPEDIRALVLAIEQADPDLPAAPEPQPTDPGRLAEYQARRTEVDAPTSVTSPDGAVTVHSRGHLVEGLAILPSWATWQPDRQAGSLLAALQLAHDSYRSALDELTGQFQDVMAAVEADRRRTERMVDGHLRILRERADRT